MSLGGEEAAECEERDARKDDGARGEDLGEAADDGEEGGGGDEVAGGEPHGEGRGVEVDGEGALDHGEAGHVCCCLFESGVSLGEEEMNHDGDEDEMERVQWMKMSTNKLMPIATPRAKPTSWFVPSRAPPPSAVCRRDASSRSSGATPESVHLPGEASPRSGSWPASSAVCSGGSSAPVLRGVDMIGCNFFFFFFL